MCIRDSSGSERAPTWCSGASPRRPGPPEQRRVAASPPAWLTGRMRYVESPMGTPVSVIGLGTWQFGSSAWGYGTEYEERSSSLVRRALDSGITLVDTAEIYGRGRSERLVGAALAERRAEAVVATKIFPVLPIAPVVEQRAVASAARLGVRRLDLYQVHQPNPVVSDTRTMAGDAGASGRRPGGPGRREQLLPGPMGGRGSRPGPAGAVQ